MTRCLSCGGTYTSVDRDGVTYFHVCPPAFTYVDAKTGVAVALADALAVVDGETLRRVELARDNPRDENVPHPRLWSALFADITHDEPYAELALRGRAAATTLTSAGAGVETIDEP